MVAFWKDVAVKVCSPPVLSPAFLTVNIIHKGTASFSRVVDEVLATT
jgi:hypothetical protein